MLGSRGFAGSGGRKRKAFSLLRDSHGGRASFEGYVAAEVYGWDMRVPASTWHALQVAFIDFQIKKIDEQNDRRIRFKMLRTLMNTGFSTHDRDCYSEALAEYRRVSEVEVVSVKAENVL